MSPASEARGSKRVRLIISGRVQGVFFRESTRREAEALGVHGWVRNRDDGTVEALMEGAPESVAALVAWCHHGPPSAKVDAVHAMDETAAGDLQGFRVTR